MGNRKQKDDQALIRVGAALMTLEHITTSNVAYQAGVSIAVARKKLREWESCGRVRSYKHYGSLCWAWVGWPGQDQDKDNGHKPNGQE